ncbi:MAG: hypothetical protein JJU37_11290 [Balneolaceae bacterium]|nr:hypothetical protein [Balneolaceae bacterium]
MNNIITDPNIPEIPAAVKGFLSMSQNNQFERDIYKSIVTGMSILLPIGIVVGLLKGNILLGLLAGNALGLTIGLTVVHLKKRAEK